MPTRRQALALTAAACAAPSAALPQSKPFVLPEHLRPILLNVRDAFEPQTIHVLPSQYHLYYIVERGRALRYGVGVGREGLEFKGTAVVERKEEWPSWRPTDEMIEREPEQYARFEDGVPGGPENPLGARALYLYQNGIDTYYRIHGTNQPSTIGTSVSNGCIRMLNSHVAHLYEQVPLGTRVTVY
ncbi:L,D-transpeptidase [Rhodobacteraceae bacterium MCCB 386]|nr:L,D-transpeptidase [Roseitranquillus sediminis]MBM9595871.1 L,D-transpeptidase [Roseitranquillus sediminis]